MSDNAPTGPSESFLRQLKGMLPSMIKGIKRGKIGGKGTPVTSSKPHKICKVCESLFDYRPSKGESELTQGVCATCQEQFDAGFTAVVCGDRVKFLKCGALADKAGEIIKVKPEVMAMIENRFEQLSGGKGPKDGA